VCRRDHSADFYQSSSVDCHKIFADIRHAAPISGDGRRDLFKQFHSFILAVREKGATRSSCLCATGRHPNENAKPRGSTGSCSHDCVASNTADQGDRPSSQGRVPGLGHIGLDLRKVDIVNYHDLILEHLF